LRQFDLQPRGYYSVVARLEPENSINVIMGGFKRSESAKKLVIVGPSTHSRGLDSLVRMRQKAQETAMGEYVKSVPEVG
jgi:hypothetical protein